MEPDVGLVIEVEMPDSQVRDLLGPGAGVVQKEQQGAIAQRAPCARRHAGEEGLDVAAFEETSLRWRHPFAGDACDLFRDGEQLRDPASEVVEEGAEDREPVVARPGVIGPTVFEGLQEAKDPSRRQGAQRQLGDAASGVIRDEAQEEPQPVAVAGDRGWTQTLGGLQVVEEEGVDHLPERGVVHRRTSFTRGLAYSSKRLPATRSSSLVMVR